MSKETLVVLNRKRGAIKTQLIRIKDFINNPNEKDKTHLESKLDILKSLRIKLSDIRDEYYEVVENYSDSEPLESEILDLEEDCEDIYIQAPMLQINGSPTEKYYYTTIGTLWRSAEAILANIRNSFWIPSARNVVRKNLRTCITCRKVSAKGSQQLMADLPAARVTACRVFSQVVKAIHLDIVSDLTTEAFLAALKRFVARRGRPIEIHSDNGQNFVGANNELRNVLKALFKESETRGQASSERWRYERSLRLSSSFFKEIACRKKSTPCSKLVMRIVYGRDLCNAAMKYGLANEEIARKQYEREYSTEVKICGLFVDKDKPADLNQICWNF
ncbi:integrase catalytic domain-containing protein [Trichonephila clavipes]|nr:integrase catalytic domain-containing protein [Trichonephila clavipes]